MLHAHTLHMTQLSEKALSQLSPSFTHLPRTEHADGQFRLRRYSVITVEQGKLVNTGKTNFMQTDDINKFQGNVDRQFEPIESSTLCSDGMSEMCQKFMETNNLPNGQEIEIHQMRITTTGEETQVAPEGVHQDGFDHIAIIGIGRHNIVGGEVLLYENQHQAPFFRKILENGDVAILADDVLWHNAQPIRAIERGEEGHMDVFVLTAKEASHALHS